jgi:hypothetical protein
MIRDFEELRDLQTAGLRCTEVLERLAHLYPSVAPGQPEGAFGHVVFRPLWDELMGPVDGDDLVEALASPASKFGRDMVASTNYGYEALLVAAAYAVQAIKAEKAGNELAAWGLAFDAGQWVSFLSGFLGQTNPDPAAARRMAETAWHLNACRRDDGLGGVLHETLQTVKDEGGRRPTASQVLQRWTLDKPKPLVSVSSDSVVFVNSNGKSERVTLPNLQSRINRLTRTGR